MENFAKIICDICHIDYDDENLPKILQCGHTFCFSCILVQSKTSLPCPECSTIISAETSLTNQFVLTLAKRMNKNKIVKSLQELEEIKKEIISQKALLINQNEKKIKIIDTCLNEIEKLFSKPENITDETIEKIKHEMLTVKKDVGFIPKLFTELTDSSESFLLKIHQEVSFGKNLRTTHLVERSDFSSSFKYGRISVHDNILFFHCLKETKPIDYWKFIRFDDLKTAVRSVKFRIFMKIFPEGGVNRIIIIKTLNSVLVPQFIRLCTGESYQCIIGKAYGDDYECSHVDYAYKTDDDDKIPVLEVGTCFVYGNTKGDFWFSASQNDGDDSFLIGVAETPLGLMDIIKDEHKILDCGIAFYL